MTKIKFDLSRSFKMVPEGERVLTITKCEPTPSGAPKAVKITWTDSEGGNILETINFDKALWKISQICECVLDAQDGQEMDVADMCKQLTGKKVLCEVVHRQGTKPREDGSFATFANVGKILSGVKEESTSATPTQTENPRSTILAGL